jgi:hypothetical protein
MNQYRLECPESNRLYTKITCLYPISAWMCVRVCSLALCSQKCRDYTPTPLQRVLMHV